MERGEGCISSYLKSVPNFWCQITGFLKKPKLNPLLNLQAVGNPLKITWTKIVYHHFSDWEGRTTAQVGFLTDIYSLFSKGG